MAAAVFLSLYFACAVSALTATSFPTASAKHSRALLSVRLSEVRQPDPHTLRSKPTRPPPATPTCVRWTGIGCKLSTCGDWQGNTSCVSGKCFCQDGFCAGVDEVCHSRGNALVGRGFTLRNARWADQYMHFPGTGSTMKVGRLDGIIGESDIFDLYRLPGANGSEFLLDSHESPNLVAGAESTLPEARHLSHRPPLKLGVRIFAAPAYEGEPKGRSVMIAPVRRALESYFFTVRAGRWDLVLHGGDPGPRGYWLLDPPDALDDVDLATFEGAPCLHDCGAYGSGTSSVGRFHAALVVLLNVTLIGGLGITLLVSMGRL